MAARAGAAARPPAGEDVSASTLEDIAAEPLVTYHPGFTGRTRIDSAFAHKKLQPRIALEAIDSDVIKTYVRLGLGIGIVAEMAVKDDGSNTDLVARPLGHLFGQNLARVAFKRGAYLRNFVYRFAELLSDRLDPQADPRCHERRATATTTIASTSWPRLPIRAAGRTRARPDQASRPWARPSSR